jgi:hypothetical protein
MLKVFCSDTYYYGNITYTHDTYFLTYLHIPTDGFTDTRCASEPEVGE